MNKIVLTSSFGTVADRLAQKHLLPPIPYKMARLKKGFVTDFHL